MDRQEIIDELSRLGNAVREIQLRIDVLLRGLSDPATRTPASRKDKYTEKIRDSIKKKKVKL